MTDQNPTSIEPLAVPAPPDILAWIDVETTGLRAGSDSLLEVACILTDTDLNQLAEPFHRVIRYDAAIIELMKTGTSQYVIDMHERTGLWDKLLTGTPRLAVDTQLEEYIREHAPEKRQARVAGNSVRLDLNFLEEWLPITYAHLHYRFLDVTGLEFALESQGLITPIGSADRNHDALSDIQASIEQLRGIYAQLDQWEL